MKKLTEKRLDFKLKETSLHELFRQLRYFWLCMAGILLSLCFPVAELQFLALSLITGAKWIAGSKNTRIIIIERGWKQ